MSSAEEEDRAAGHNRGLLLEIIGSIVERSVPLHLAVQLTPDALREMWVGMDLELLRDFLAARRHPGLLHVAMLSARLTAEEIFDVYGDPFALELVARAHAVIAGIEPTTVLLQRQRELTLRQKGHVAPGSRAAERLELLQFAGDAVMRFADLKRSGTDAAEAAEDRFVIRSAQSVILRGLDYLGLTVLGHPARAQIEAALRALGPPTLEEIVVAAERSR